MKSMNTNYEAYHVFAKEAKRRGQEVVQLALPLHLANQRLISSTQYIIQSTSKMIPKCKARNKT